MDNEPKSRKITLPSQETKSVRLKEVIDVSDNKYLPQAIKIAEIFNQAVTKDGDLDLQKAIELVKQHPTMVIFQIINQRLESKTITVKGEIDQIAETLEAILHNYDVNKENLKTSLEDAFLKLSSDEPYFNVVSTDSDKTTYKYNLLYILHNKNTGSLLVANPITLTVSLNINQDKIYHLTETDKVMFTVDFSGLLVGEILRTE